MLHCLILCIHEASSSSSEDDTEEVDPDDLWEDEDEDDAEPEVRFDVCDISRHFLSLARYLHKTLKCCRLVMEV